MAVIVGLIKLTLYGLVFCTPMLGVWLVSSLVAFTNGPMGLTIFSGLLFFPLLPILWDLWAQRKRRSQPGILTWGDRITLRTLVLNVVFISALLALRPETAFLALSTRGDWMLDGRSGQPVEWVRQSLFKTAGGLEWLYSSVRQNPYHQDAPTIRPRPTDLGQTTSPRQPTSSEQTASPSTPSVSQAASNWPWTGMGLHPAVAQMPANVETSIASVAQYIAQQEPDPMLRIKALHDYVADRVAYDVPALRNPSARPPQDATTVFQTHKAVCEGYARLMVALGEEIGETILYISGDSRSLSNDLSGQGHAWNAAQINGNWYLLDATWDSGFVDDTTFTKAYKTDYLFPPADVMVMSHLPEDPAWQLLAKPLSIGEFLRQPMLRPSFFAQGLRLISPDRSQSHVEREATIHLENPDQRWIMASYRRKGSQQQERCSDETSQGPTVTCSLPSAGTYHVMLFVGDEAYGSYASVGQFEFNRQS